MNKIMLLEDDLSLIDGLQSVSYTHLDVYKRQAGYSLVSSDTVVFEDEDNEPSKYLLYGYNLR